MRGAVTSNVHAPTPTQQKEKLLRIIDVKWGEGGVSTVPSCSAESRLERRSKFKLLSALTAE
jgi:hypothetical protein